MPGRGVADRIGGRALVAVAAVLTLGMTSTAIVATSYRGDDLINKDIDHYLIEHNTSLAQLFFEYTNGWVVSQGRFFPGSVALTLGMFSALDSRIEYKLALALLAAAAAAALVALVWVVSRNATIAGLSAIVVAGTLQIRDFHDGLISYVGLLPITAALTMAACAIALAKRGALWMLLAASLYGVALLTYESVFALAPAIVALVAVRRGWRPAIAMAIPALATLVVSLWLRSTVQTGFGSAYTPSLDPGAVAVTFAKQFTAALPGSQWTLGAVQPIALPLIAMSLAVLGVPVLLAARWLCDHLPPADPRSIILLCAFGLWTWVSTSGLIAITERWQAELPFGQGYLSVVYGYLGFAIVLSGTWWWLNSRIRGLGSARVWTVWRWAAPAILSVMCSLTVAGNFALAN